MDRAAADSIACGRGSVSLASLVRACRPSRKAGKAGPTFPEHGDLPFHVQRMSIYLFTDFGTADIYVGQVKAVLHEIAPNAGVIDLLHEAPAFNIRAGAHLLAALSVRMPAESIVLAVVDPGVGGLRSAVAARVDGRWLVGPDNGLLSVAIARAQSARIFPITWIPEGLSASFHGRDLFAPVAGRLAAGKLRIEGLPSKPRLDVEYGAEDLAEIVYIDHYGNAMTGLRADASVRGRQLLANGRRITYQRVFSEAAAGNLFWYENSIGLIEIAANSSNAAAQLGLQIGQSLAVETS